MSHQWGRPADAGSWPRPKHLWTIGVFVVAMVSGVATGAYRYTSIWTALQRAYFAAYLRSHLASAVGSTRGRYQLLYVTDRKGERLALNEDVQPATTPAGEQTVALSAIAFEAGVRRLRWGAGQFSHEAVRTYLREAIYGGERPIDLVRQSLWSSIAVLLAGSLITLPKDIARARARRHGQRLKGPELVSVRRFNRRLRADGIGFAQRSFWLAPFQGRGARVRVPRTLEASHILIMGDSGTGKSSLIRQLLQQLDMRGDTAIVYDPAREYTPQFYRPDRGDLVLNPLDTRCPYWSPGDELRRDAEALTLATSLFPDRPNDNPFFIDTSRRIFAHLLTFRPDAPTLASWLCNGDELDRRVRGTPYATMIDPQAPAQQSGVLASLNLVADTLKLIAPESQARGRWSALAWAQRRRGWLFFTSTPETRTSLVPLTSLWLDMLVLRLMTPRDEAFPPVWFVLDELATLQRLPQLHTAVTENRKSQNPVVLGFQGRSQLETRYGHDAEAMLSQPGTKIFLRTSEPRAANWISETIGQIEVERLRESRSSGQGSQQSYGLERHVEPLVMASEISGLPNLRGYLKVENLVVRLHVPYIDLPTVHPGFEERPDSPACTGPAEVSACPPVTPAATSADTPKATEQQAPRAETMRRHEPFFQ